MNILGIETSCDETAAAVVRDGVEVLSNVIATSLKDHQRFGGIIPEIASRRQIEFIQGIVGEALSQARMTLEDIDDSRGIFWSIGSCSVEEALNDLDALGLIAGGR